MRRSRIGFLFLHPFSESLGSTTRVLEIAKSLRRKGYEVVIYDPFEKEQLVDGVKVRKIRLFGPFDLIFRRIYYALKKIYYGEKTKKLTASKIFRENAFYRSIAKDLIKKITQDKLELLVIEQDFAIVPGILAAKETNIPAIVDLHNITAEELVAAGIINYEDEEFLEMQKELGALLNETDGIVVVSEALRNYVRETYNFNKDIVLVPPSGRPRISKIPQRTPPYKLIYAGLVSYREKVDLFVKSLPYLNEKGFKFETYMTRKGEELNKIMQVSSQKKLKINFFWFKSRRDLFDFMKTCHVGILTSSKNKARELGPPIKLLDYISVGLPVVANYIGGWSEIIEKEKIGILTDSTPKDFANGIIELISDLENYYRYANNALNLVREKYNWDKSITPLINLISKIS